MPLNRNDDWNELKALLSATVIESLERYIACVLAWLPNRNVIEL